MVNRLGAGAAFGAETLLKKEAAVAVSASSVAGFSSRLGPGARCLKSTGENRLGDDRGTDEAARRCPGPALPNRTEP